MLALLSRSRLCPALRVHGDLIATTGPREEFFALRFPVLETFFPENVSDFHTAAGLFPRAGKPRAIMKILMYELTCWLLAFSPE